MEDEDLKEGLKKSMSEPAKKKKRQDDESPTRQQLAHQDNEARDFRDVWESKFKRNRA